MLDYRFDQQTEGWDAERACELRRRLRALVKNGFDAPRSVRVVDYPPGSVRIINLEEFDGTTIEEFLAKANGVYAEVMGLATETA